MRPRGRNPYNFYGPDGSITVKKFLLILFRWLKVSFFSNLTSFANSATSVSRSTASSAKVSSANRERQQPKIICFSSPLLNFYANDHIMLNTLVLVRSLKLRNIESVLVWVTTREHWVLLAFLFTPPQTNKQT